VLQHGGGVGVLTLSLLGAIWSCMAAVVSLMTALNRAYDVRETRSFWAVRGMALLATIVLGVLAVVAAGITVAVPVVGGAIGGRFGHMVSWLRFPVAGALMILVLATTYRFLPNIKPRLQAIMPGSLVGVGLWLLTSWGFSAYVRNIGTYEIVYGVLGGVIVLLLWMWISGQVVLLGAEINKLLTPREDLDRITTPHETASSFPESRPDRSANRRSPRVSHVQRRNESNPRANGCRACD